MIVIDTSALIAILQHEPERVAFFDAIARADQSLVSAVTYQEAGQVIYARLGPDGLHDLSNLLETIDADIVAHDEELSTLAIEAFTRFGKGFHGKARLNFCDCAAYALSKKVGAPLLFKGKDFAATDIVAALPARP